MLSKWPRIHPPVCWLRLRRKPVMMNPVHMKSQNQSKRYTSIILILMPHNQSILICTCHTLKVWKWTGWSTMCYTIDSSSGNPKCENILECELAALPDCQKYKKVIVWSDNFGMDQYVSWGLSKDDTNLETIWERFEDFCKPQSNQVHAWFDLLTSFCQGNKSINEWYNTVQVQVNLVKYPLETAKILNCNIFWFFLCDEDFVSRTLTEGSVDLDKFPASRVCQLAKRFESSKATAYHIKQVAGDPHDTQINLMRHQQTELPTNRHNKKRRPTGRLKLHKAPKSSASNQVKKFYDNRKPHRAPDCCNKCGNSIHVQVFQCPAKKYQCKVCNKYGHFSSLCYQKKTQAYHKNSNRNPKVHQLHAGPMYAQDSANLSYSEEWSSDESFCL